MPKADQRRSYCINGHTLDGQRRNGHWSFKCSFKEVEQAFNGDSVFTGARDLFEKMALARGEGKHG